MSISFSPISICNDHCNITDTLWLSYCINNEFCTGFGIQVVQEIFGTHLWHGTSLTRFCPVQTQASSPAYVPFSLLGDPPVIGHTICSTILLLLSRLLVRINKANVLQDFNSYFTSLFPCQIIESLHLLPLGLPPPKNVNCLVGHQFVLQTAESTTESWHQWVVLPMQCLAWLWCEIWSGYLNT